MVTRSQKPASLGGNQEVRPFIASPSFPHPQAPPGLWLHPHMATCHYITSPLHIFERHLSLDSRLCGNNPGYSILSHSCKDPISYLRLPLKLQGTDLILWETVLSFLAEPQAHRHTQGCDLPVFELCLYASWKWRLTIRSQEQHKKGKVRETVNCQK